MVFVKLRGEGNAWGSSDGLIQITRLLDSLILWIIHHKTQFHMDESNLALNK